ncbi:ABC transporter permease [Lentilactobacillus otakiensis]|uniref:ABC transporter permease n=3 Tax=Lentilactobacillus otakiensis TaxID=481720 RepID=UPI003D17E2C9
MTWFAPLLLLAFMVLISDYPSNRLLAMMTYDSTDAIMIILVIVGSTMFSMEFQNNAILTLLYKSPRALYVYLNKFITIFIYDLILHGLAIIFTFGLATTINPVSWLAVYQYQQPLIVNMFLATGVDILTSMLIISVVFLISTLINSNAVVVTASLAVMFFGEAISTDLTRGYSALTSLAKWNPFNMTLLTHQYVNYGGYYDTTLLTNGELALGAFVYIVIFFAFGYLVFRQKRY